MFCDSGVFTKKIDCYKIHILLFILALFIAITVAHPSLFVNDEWVTVNQLAQLQEGHQVLLNEGKYGTADNGTLSQYFINKNNYLAYPLFLPLISLPAFWLISGMGEFFVFAIVYLWTFLLIAIALVTNVFFREYSYMGKYRWTSGLIIAAFVLFFYKR